MDHRLVWKAGMGTAGQGTQGLKDSGTQGRKAEGSKLSAEGRNHEQKLKC